MGQRKKVSMVELEWGKKGEVRRGGGRVTYDSSNTFGNDVD